MKKKRERDTLDEFQEMFQWVFIFEDLCWCRNAVQKTAITLMKTLNVYRIWRNVIYLIKNETVEFLCQNYSIQPWNKYLESNFNISSIQNYTGSDPLCNNHF